MIRFVARFTTIIIVYCLSVAYASDKKSDFIYIYCKNSENKEQIDKYADQLITNNLAVCDNDIYFEYIDMNIDRKTINHNTDIKYVKKLMKRLEYFANNGVINAQIDLLRIAIFYFSDYNQADEYFSDYFSNNTKHTGNNYIFSDMANFEYAISKEDIVNAFKFTLIASTRSKFSHIFREGEKYYLNILEYVVYTNKFEKVINDICTEYNLYCNFDPNDMDKLIKSYANWYLSVSNKDRLYDVPLDYQNYIFIKRGNEITFYRSNSS